VPNKIKFELYIDNERCGDYIGSMRWQAVIILAAIIVSIVAPASLPLIAERGGESTIGTLNICHSAAPALSSSGQTPCVNEYQYKPRPFLQNHVSQMADPLVKPLFIVFQDERPPKV
jgi:hypothetical protein